LLEAREGGLRLENGAQLEDVQKAAGHRQSLGVNREGAGAIPRDGLEDGMSGLGPEDDFLKSPPRPRLALSVLQKPGRLLTHFAAGMIGRLIEDVARWMKKPSPSDRSA
jgi:hypothetical protein